MDNNKTYAEKIAALLEAFGEIDDNDIEEAKAVIRAAGKDPEKIVEKGLQRLEQIKKRYTPAERNNRKLQSGFKVIVRNPLSQTIELTDTADDYLLNIDEVFTYLIPSEENPVPADYKIADDVADLKIRRFMVQLVFTVEFRNGAAYVLPYINTRTEKIRIHPDETDIFLRTCYAIIQGKLHPIDPDTVLAGKKLWKETDGRHCLPPAIALRYFASRKNSPWITFDPEADIMSHLIPSDKSPDKISLFTKELYTYQQDGLKWLQYCCINRIGGILGDDMGLGKTAQTIALIAWIVETGILDSILIVVPSTLIENWKREMAFFAPQIVPYIHHGNLRRGNVKHLVKHKVVITSYSMVINDQFMMDKHEWGLVLMDEASLVKNPDSERRKALAAIPAAVRIAMTGTPVENSLMDLWSIADLVNPGYLGSKEAFSAEYIRKNITDTLEKVNLEALRNTTSPILLRRRKEEVLDNLPERIDIHQALVQHDNEARLYEDQRLAILSDIATVSGENILQLIQQMRQYTTHPFLREPETLKTATLSALRDSSIKFTRTVELLEEICSAEEKVLIFTEYLNMIDTMQRVFQEHFNVPVYTIDGRVDVQVRQENIDRFSATTGFSIMLLNPRTAGMGLNITAANHVIHYTRQWNPALEEQATARAYRNKQTRSVNIYYLFYAGTIEEAIDIRLKEKKMLSHEIIIDTDSGNDMEFYLHALKQSPLT